ncbi:YHS domain-containing (seleno)protein [Rhodoferax ferrireducens]|uniref:YHS domain-containing (seleno)protein n=1 Tax=Rhodoferax ferrireducens TaxID=192843 RepID=UPI003BB50CC5
MPTQFRSSRRSFVASAALMALASLTLPDLAHAYDEQSTSALNVDANGIALKGFDPVSYFSPSGPVPGKAELFAKYEGATYQFASSQNRDTFSANPAKYTPAYGGFCAMGVALEQKLDVDPQLWRVVDGKLYLNVHKGAQTRWLEDVKGNLAKAEKNWPRLKDKAPKTL